MVFKWFTMISFILKELFGKSLAEVVSGVNSSCITLYHQELSSICSANTCTMLIIPLSLSTRKIEKKLCSQ